MGLVIGRIGKTLKRNQVWFVDQLGLLLSIIEESLSGCASLKPFTAERYQKAVQSGEPAHYNCLLRSELPGIIQSGCPSAGHFLLGSFVMVWRAAGHHGESVLTGEMFIGYIVIFANLINPAKSFAKQLLFYSGGIASIERIEAMHR